LDRWHFASAKRCVFDFLCHLTSNGKGFRLRAFALDTCHALYADIAFHVFVSAARRSHSAQASSQRSLLLRSVAMRMALALSSWYA
jgi:hypothetical protein